MIVPLLLFLMSLTLAAYALLNALHDLTLLGALTAVASLVLLLRAVLLRRPVGPRWIVVDGSNVLWWNENIPALDSVARVAADLVRRGYVPLVWFDANVGYVIADRFLPDHQIARRLGLASTQVFVAPKGTPADPLVLREARQRQACIVTNDRYRDWTEAHPEVLTPGHLIRGSLREGMVALDLPVPERESLSA